MGRYETSRLFILEKDTTSKIETFFSFDTSIKTINDLSLEMSWNGLFAFVLFDASNDLTGIKKQESILEKDTTSKSLFVLAII